MSRIETRRTVEAFDEARIRADFLAGMRPSEIAARYNERYAAAAQFISTHKQRWLDEARFCRIQADDRKIVLPRRVFADNGSYVMPVSLPRITMHVKAMEAAAHG